MANSITASTVSPYSGYLLSDINYVATQTFPSASQNNATLGLQLPNFDYPTAGQFIVQLANTALSNSAGTIATAITLQDSVDNTNWASVKSATGFAVFSSSILPCVDNSGTVVAQSTQVLLPPKLVPGGNYYIRAQATVPSLGATAGGITGSYSITLLF